jgi:hypothetical protein
MHKFKPNDVVLLKLKDSGPMKIRVLEKLEDAHSTD